jgi:LysM repeat protein
MIRGRTLHALIAVLLLFVIIDVGAVNWLLTPPLTRVYVVRPGQTLADIAARFQIHPQTVIDESGLRPGIPLQSGQVLTIPMPLLGPFRNWKLQLAGLSATLVGGMVALCLCAANNIMAPGHRGVEIAIALAVALVHYLVAQTNTVSLPEAISPAFVLASLVDGFAWTCLLPLLSRALGGGEQDG